MSDTVRTQQAKINTFAFPLKWFSDGPKTSAVKDENILEKESRISLIVLLSSVEETRCTWVWPVLKVVCNLFLGCTLVL